MAKLIERALAIPTPGVGLPAEELEWLAEQASKHSVIVEIGSWLGRSARAMGDNTDGVVYALDDWRGLREAWLRAEPFTTQEKEDFFGQFCSNLSDLIETGKVRPIEVNHADAAQVEVTPDMVFIDGNHTYAAVSRDIEIWKAKIAPGGLICGHDFNLYDVSLAVHHLLPGAKKAPGLLWEYTVS